MPVEADRVTDARAEDFRTAAIPRLMRRICPFSSGGMQILHGEPNVDCRACYPGRSKNFQPCDG